MLEPFLVQVRVSGGLPDHLQFRATSESTSTVMGLGSTTSMGPTERQALFYSPSIGVFICSFFVNLIEYKERSDSRER